MTVLEEEIHVLQQEKSPEQESAIAVQNVLFATDFSETAEAALPYAIAICRRFGSTLPAVHVVSEASTLLMTGGVDLRPCARWIPVEESCRSHRRK